MNAKKRALGKGLGALLDNSGVEPQPTYDVGKDLMAVGTIGKVSIDLIEANPYQPRTDFDEEALNDLAASIKEQGVIQPITLRKIDGQKLQLISGERRLKASKMAGLKEIPAYIMSADDHSMLEMAIVENIQRENLNPVEIAMGYKRLIHEYELTQEMLSERLGKSRPSIANHLRLLNLPGEIQIGVRQEMITMGHAKALLSIEDFQTQMEVYQDIIEQSLSVREVEEIIRDLGSKDESPQPGKKKKESSSIPDSEASDRLKRDLEGIYEAKVQVKAKPGGKGSIMIHYKSIDDLNRISILLKR